jgi:hypothetical protein
MEFDRSSEQKTRQLTVEIFTLFPRSLGSVHILMIGEESAKSPTSCPHPRDPHFEGISGGISRGN